jgi:Domain of unknown function (DUF4470)
LVASGDLRNIIRTINELPSDFSGELNVLLNDREPFIVIRNIILLLLLGTVSEKVQAAELALHFWYSAFVPVQYHTQLQCVLLPFLTGLARDSSISLSLGSHSTMSGAITPRAISVFSAILQAQYQIGDASNELHRVRYGACGPTSYHI